MAKKYALLVGTSQFNDKGLKTLFAPEEDVTRFRDVLLDKKLAAFDDAKIFMNSSMSAVRTAVSNLFTDRAADDLVLFYYSGHGLTDIRGRLYFSLPESDSEEPSTRSLEASYVRQQMNDSNSLRQIIILDCCHSGAFTRDGSLTARADSNAPKLTEKTFDPNGHGRFVLAASAASESSFEKDGKSVYTQTLVEGLETGEAAPDKDEITISDLHNYVSRKVKTTKAPMQPRLWSDEQTDPLVIARNPNPERPIPEEVKEALQSENATTRLGAVTEFGSIIRDGSKSQRQEVLKLLEERANDPNETNKVSNAAKEIMESARLTGEPKKEEPLGAVDYGEAGEPAMEAIAPTTSQPKIEPQASQETSLGPGRLTAALQTAVLTFPLCLIASLSSNLSAGPGVHNLLIIIVLGLTLATVMGFEIWRRGGSLQNSFRAIMFFAIVFPIAPLAPEFIPSTAVIDYAVSSQYGSIFIFTLIGLAGTGTALASGMFGIRRLRKPKFAIPILLVGGLISFLTSFQLVDEGLSLSYLIMIFSPLIAIVFFLIFCCSSFTQLRSSKAELYELIRQLNSRG